MSALTYNIIAPHKDITELRSVLVGAAVQIFKSAIVCGNATGYSIPGADTAGLKFQGICDDEADNSLGADGAIPAIINVGNKVWNLQAAGADQSWVGKTVYVVDDQTVALFGTVVNKIPVGICWTVDSATSIWVETLPGEFGTLVGGSGGLTTGLVALAAGGQTGATALSLGMNNVITSATAGDSVKLPSAVSGNSVRVKNSGATAIDIFPFLADSIDALAVNLAVRLDPGGIAEFNAISATVWESSVDVSLTLNSPTTLRGNLRVLAADNDANHITTLTNKAMGQDSVISLPDPGAAAADVLLTTANNDGQPVTSKAVELNQLDGGWASFTTTTVPASGSCAIQLVFYDAAGVIMTEPVTGELYLSKVATGLTEDLVGTTFAVLTNGVLTALIAKGRSAFITDAVGKLGMTITNGAADSFWIVFKSPSGKLIISDECIENA